jgi:hypothetical protein
MIQDESLMYSHSRSSSHCHFRWPTPETQVSGRDPGHRCGRNNHLIQPSLTLDPWLMACDCCLLRRYQTC